MLDIKDIKVTVKHFSGTNRQIADRARTTIGLGEGTKELTTAYMNKLYKCEHSVIRVQTYLVKIENIPYWIVMHLVRHKIGIEHWVRTQRDDRLISDVPRDEKGQGEPVTYEFLANAQALIAISRKRLCFCAHYKTVAIWETVIDELRKINPTLADNCVRECTYRNGFCPEHKTCGYNQSPYSKKEVKEYINVNQ